MDLKQRTSLQKMKRSHVVITGTGRTGTTFLVQLFTMLGYDTGYSKDCKSRLANSRSKDDCPFIVKDPRFCTYADQAISRADIEIEHVLLPVRDIGAAVASRCRNKGDRQGGGLWLTKVPDEQEQILLRLLSGLLVSLARTNVPVTLLHYPTLVNNSMYLYDRLRPLLGIIDYETFKIVFERTVEKDWVHQFNENDS